MKSLKNNPESFNSNIEIRGKYQNNINKPLKPEKKNFHEQLAQKKLESYKPSIFDKVLGSAKIEMNWLNYLVKNAIIEDFKEYKLKYNEYLLELEIWGN